MTWMDRMVAVCALALALAAAACDGSAKRPATLSDDIFGDAGDPVGFATAEQRLAFERGRRVALRRFAPDEGFGPQFNVASCAACHEKPVIGGAGGRYRNFLLVFQRLDSGVFAGVGTNGVQNQFTIATNARVPTAEGAEVVATRNPIPFFGVGLLAEIPEAEILRRADPEDADGDGISGRANVDRELVGRFGRKAQTASLESFIRGPLFNHMGVTSNPLPNERRAQLPVPEATTGPRLLVEVGALDRPTVDDDGVPDPEMSEGELFDLVSFTMLMAPLRPAAASELTEAGAATFETIGCASCHVPALQGPRGPVPAYTDLLVHDMGPELADGIAMGQAGGAEFRTAPLWGIAAVAPYLHDGRADTLDEAIRWHGGEAEAARRAYEALASGERAAVLAFLESLGGSDVRSDGLLPPDAPLRATGAYGGPMASLSGAERERFVRGRALFDRDLAIAEGLGPRFNGDACRACHFDPVIGGAGPSDVDVIRHGVVDVETGAFRAPDIGTMAHRHATDPSARPPADGAANVFEARQTPPLFGLGLIERVPEASILALADPDDLDGDGISGRAHVLPDGRLGRFGWKANVPSLAEFARDALFNELGITLPPQAGLSFGAERDDDGAPDPEISVEDVEALAFYMQTLAPPPRTRSNAAREDEGAAVFEAIGCAVCHVPSLQTQDGVGVPLYSDLLLHDVAPPYSLGIEDGDAAMRELRTPPLWGLATSAPYMHDGAAATVEQAILQHAGEARAARDAYLDLPPDAREVLRYFLESL